MSTIPNFDSEGLLPAGDCEVSFGELRTSILVVGPVDPVASPSWAACGNCERRTGAAAQSAEAIQDLDVECGFAETVSRLSEEAAPDVAQVSSRVVSARAGPGDRVRHF